MNIALKEWDLVINALLAGTQMLLLRKGGILEAENQFELEHSRFLLFPTFVHQDPRMVKPPFRAGLQQVRAEPEKLTLKGFGEAAGIFEVPSRAALEKLDDLHVWDAPLLDMRFSYRPEKPLYAVVVRAFALPAPATVPNTLAYAGCKSWVPLEEEIAETGARVAIEDRRFAALLERIRVTLAESASG